MLLSSPYEAKLISSNIKSRHSYKLVTDDEAANWFQTDGQSHSETRYFYLSLYFSNLHRYYAQQSCPIYVHTLLHDPNNTTMSMIALQIQAMLYTPYSQKTNDNLSEDKTGLISLKEFFIMFILIKKFPIQIEAVAC